MLPAIIRALGLAHTGRREREHDRREENQARQEAITAAIERLDELAQERNLTDEFVRPIRAAYRDRLRHVQHRSDGEDSHRKLIELHDEIESHLISAERRRVNELYRAGKIIDEARRRIERELDLREAHLANQRADD